jgi:hypothetical protein
VIAQAANRVVGDDPRRTHATGFASSTVDQDVVALKLRATPNVTPGASIFKVMQVPVAIPELLAELPPELAVPVASVPLPGRPERVEVAT